MKKFSLFLLVLVVVALVIAACQPETETVEVTRVITETEEVVVTQVVEKVVEVEGEAVEVEVTRVVETVVEVPAEPTEKTVVEFWSTDKEPDRVELYEDVAARFMAENPGIDLRIVAIDEAEVSQRIATAVGANRLPDIVRMGIERVAAFAADGIGRQVPGRTEPG